MRTINLNREQPKLKIQLSETSEILLTLRRVPNKIAKEFETKLGEISKKFELKEVDAVEYFYLLIDHLCEGFDREKFDEIDVNSMQEISEALIELRRPDNSKEKKTE